MRYFCYKTVKWLYGTKFLLDELDSFLLKNAFNCEQMENNV